MIHVCDNYNREEGNIHFPNGILLEGDEGRIFVNRDRLTGKPVEEMTDADKKKLHEQVVKLYNGKEPGDHMRNFFDAVKSRGMPISDVETHHRTMTSCHLCNIALMLGRELKWDPEKQAVRRRRAGDNAHVPPAARKVFLGRDDLGHVFQGAGSGRLEPVALRLELANRVAS